MQTTRYYLDVEQEARKAITITDLVTASSAMMAVAMEIANRAEFPGMATYTSPVLYRPPQHIYGQMPDYGDDWGAFPCIKLLGSIQDRHTPTVGLTAYFSF